VWYRVVQLRQAEAEIEEQRKVRDEHRGISGATGEEPKLDHCNKQLDEYLDDTLTTMEDLKLQALAIKVTLRKDERTLDRLQPLAERTNERIRRNTETAKVLCKK